MGIGISREQQQQQQNSDPDGENTSILTQTTPTTATASSGFNHHHRHQLYQQQQQQQQHQQNQWKHQQQNHHVRQASVRSRASQPMPDNNELDKRFAKVLASMDLPPDKAKLLKNYDNEKKWDIICDQEMVQAKDPPSHYLTKLRTYLDPKASRSHRKRKIVGESTSTQVLRDLEISLRTNHIEWVKEFLDEENQGLDSLVDYLSFRLTMMRHEHRIMEAKNVSDERLQMNTSSGITSTMATTSSIVNHNNNHNNNNINNNNHNQNNNNNNNNNSNSIDIKQTNGFIRPGLGDLMDSPSLKRRSRHIAKLNMGASTDDIHVCIMCLRAIMNNKYGFNMVIQHREAINCIALSLIHKSLRTKALVLELLAAICLVKGGHEIILSAFDNFKESCHETKRFHTLMNYFINYDLFNIDFMVACMQFVNIVVHSVENMNYRVHLQYEFTALGLDDYLEKLRLTESEELHVQISAYLDNVFDVAALMEDSETKTSALERVQELEEDLGRALENVNETEREFMCKLAELETELNYVRQDRDELHNKYRQTDDEVSTLRKVLKQHEMELMNQQNMLETKNLELQTLTKSLPKGMSLIADKLSADTQQYATNSMDKSIAPPPVPPPPPSSALHTAQMIPSAVAASTSPPPPPPPPPCPPPPPLMPYGNLSDDGTQINHNNHITSIPKPPGMYHIPAPPIPGFMPAPDGAMTIKRKVQTKYKLPTLNWIALKPNQVRGTIFNELDDDKLFKHIDFVEFEERFKIGVGGPLMNGRSDVDGLNTFPSKRFRKPENVSVLEHTRLRNIAISRRKLDMSVDLVIKAINNLDLKQLSLENVEILQKMVPTEQEIKAYKEYVGEKKDVNLLTDEDKFMMQLTKVERIASKLSIMNYMGNYVDSLHLINPQIYAIISAGSSVKSSKKFRAVLEVILAFGNYLNSSKRGPAYGFKLQSLDTLLDTKSTDKRICLLHYIVATIRQKFPDLLNFDTELFCIDKAAQVSLENVITDVHELDKGMDVVRKEADLRGKGAHNHVLRDFLNNSEEKLKKMKHDAKSAQDVFKECVEYFGESSRNADANAFFSLLVRFTRAFKSTDQDNEQRRRLEQAAALAASKKENEEVVLRNNKINQKKQQEAVINELKTKTNAVREKKLLHQDEVYNGALEDILLGLKSEPYRRADAVRRSQRRRIDNNRLSRTMEELEL